jgi:methylated-DNA-[protein]-cysteine S-methyltransferase
MQCFYNIEVSSLGTFGLVWRVENTKMKVIKIFLPTDKNILVSKLRDEYSLAKRSNSLEKITLEIKRFISGENIKFDLGLLDFDICTDFEKKVLMAEYNIPRGHVSTYSRIAKKIGTPKGARAVGNALANNPFPLIIPCHRAIRSDGTLGGFQGGFEMKKKLLENEGVVLSNGKVSMDKIYY